MLHILPQDWNSPVPIGHALDAVIYTSAHSVELHVNGVSLGRQPVPLFGVVRYRNVTFRPGQLDAFAWDLRGNMVANATVKTTKPPARLVLTIDAPTNKDPIRADGQDVALVRCAVVDSNGAVVPDARHNVTFSVTGPGRIYGVANGDPVDHSPDKSTWRRVFKGLARVIVQSSADGVQGLITLTADAEGLETGTVTVMATVGH